MAIDYQQTDTTAAAGAVQACSANAVIATAQSFTASAGGTAGSTPVTVGGAAFDNGNVGSMVMFQIVPAAGVTWAAGNWTVRLNVTTAVASVVWSATYICRLNSSNVNQGSIASLTGQTTSIGTTGVKTHTVNQASPVTPSAGDQVYIVLVFTASANNRSFGITPNQLITSPFTGGATTWSVTAANIGTHSLGGSDARSRQVTYKRNPVANNLGGRDGTFRKVSPYLRQRSNNLGAKEPALLTDEVSPRLLSPEKVAPRESLSRHADATRQLNDKSGANELVSRIAAYYRTRQDNTGLEESTGRHLDPGRFVSDSLGPAELLKWQAAVSLFLQDRVAVKEASPSRRLDASRTVSNLLGLGELLRRHADANRPLSNSLATGEFTARRLDASRPLSDATAVPDSTARRLDPLRTLSNLLALAELVSLVKPGGGTTWTRSLTSLLAVAEPALLTEEYLPRLLSPEKAGLSEAALRHLNALRQLSNLAGLTDLFIRRGFIYLSVSSLLGLNEPAFDVDATHALEQDDPLGLKDVAARRSSPLRTPSDRAGLRDASARHADAARQLATNLALAEAASRTVTGRRTSSDKSATTDATTRRLDAQRLLLDRAGLKDSLNVLLLTPGLLVAHVTDFLAAADTSRRRLNAARPLTTNLAAATATARSVTSRRTLSDTLAAAQAVARLASSLRRAADSLGIKDTTTAELIAGMGVVPWFLLLAANRGAF